MIKFTHIYGYIILIFVFVLVTFLTNNSNSFWRFEYYLI